MEALGRFVLTKEREEELKEILEMSAPYVHNIYCSKLPSHLQYLILLGMIPMSVSFFPPLTLHLLGSYFPD
jgi:hypothetical protein